MPRYEGGTAPLRLQWVEEDTAGEPPENPEWNQFSYNVESFWNWEPDAETTPLRGAGDVKPRGFFNGAETHEASFEYSLVQWFRNGSGDTQDPSNAALDVGTDNDIQETHTVVSRQDYSSGGEADGGRRVFVVGRGGHPSSVTIPFETEEGTPILVDLAYEFEKIRAYQIDQPDSSVNLEVESTDAADDDQDLELEDEDAGTSETVSLNGTTTETTTAEFDNIDAAELDSETVGDVIVEDGSGNELLRIKGSDSYPADEGDLGVPALGSGNNATAISEGSEVIFLGDTIDYDGTPIADEIESGDLEVDLGIDSNTQTETAARNIHITEWGAELTASVAGTDATEQQMVDYLTQEDNDVKWTTTNGESITLEDGRLISPGEFVGETGQAKLMLDGTWQFEDIDISDEE